MGEVFRARDTRLQRDVAVKALPAEFAKDPERLARFEREARVLASLNHANVASIYGLEQDSGDSYLVLECIEGETLAERLAGGPLPVDEALRVAGEIAAGVGAAHEAGVIHRDLKPGNVMLRRDGTVKVLDFGLAKTPVRSGGSGEESRSPTISLGTEVGIILGTAAYMSPEQARGRALDKRTDIFSFGCILYECLTGRRAFPGKSVSDTLSAIVADEPDWSVLPPDLPGTVRELLKRCLRKEPRRRLQDITDARLEIEEALLPGAPDGSHSSAAPRRAGRGRIGWLAAGILAGAAAATAFLSIRRAPAPVSPAVHAVLALPDGVRLLSGGRPSFALSPDGTVVIFRGAEKGVSRLYRQRIDGGEAAAIPGTEGAILPFFSPDGEWLAFFASAELWKVPLAGGSRVRICEVPVVSQGGTWTADGSILFARTPNDGLWRVSDKGGAPEAYSALAAGEHAHRYPQALPNGKGVLVTIVRGADFQDLESAEIAVLEPGTLKRLLVLEGSSFARYVHPGRLVFVRGAGVFVAPFDLDRLATTGPPSPVSDALAVDLSTGTAQFSGAGGVFVAVTGAPSDWIPTTVLLLDRNGNGAALPLPPSRYTYPSLSPDGRQLALVRWARQPGKFLLYDRARQVLAPLTTEPGRFFCPAWSPDGRRMAFARFHDGDPRLAVKATDGTGEIEYLAPNLQRAEFPSSWSPDGTTIAYSVVSRTRSGRATEIWMLTLGSKPEEKVWLGGPHNKFGGFFSPDGRRVAYVSNESGKDEVYVRPFAGAGPRVKISADGGGEPAWTRGGREIVYRSGDQFLSVELSTAGDPIPGAPRVLFSRAAVSGDREDDPREYDVSPDGNSFVLIEQTRVPETTTRLLLMAPWPRADQSSPH
jgi:Tol biopolymer transport system component